MTLIEKLITAVVIITIGFPLSVLFSNIGAIVYDNEDTELVFYMWLVIGVAIILN